MILSLEEMKTEFRIRQKGAMIRWLQREGFIFRVGGDGWPIISRTHVDEVLGCKLKKTRGVADVKLGHLKGAEHGKTKEESPRPA